MSTRHDEAVIATPFGRVGIIGDDNRLHRVRFVEEALRPAAASAVREAALQIEAYFAGELTVFDLPLDPARTKRGEILRGGIAGIGYGETLSYGALARVMGSGARAIGQACARNPFPIVVPCHRVLGAAGLGHYTGGRGLDTKRALLAHEARVSGRDFEWAA